MLLVSWIPKSITFPKVTARRYGPLPLPLSTTPPAAVAVHWLVGVRLPPYSSGKRYCRSAAQKWLEVSAIARRARPVETKQAESASPSAIVAQALYSPTKGICSARIV